MDGAWSSRAWYGRCSDLGPMRISTIEPLGLRERVLLRGAETLGDADLLALLLGTGAQGTSARSLASAVLDASGGLEGVRRLGAHGLSERHGIGPAKAARII